MTSHDNQDARRQREYKARMRAKGFELVPVWVPAECREKIREFARRLREGAQMRREKEGKD